MKMFIISVIVLVTISLTSCQENTSLPPSETSPPSFAYFIQIPDKVQKCPENQRQDNNGICRTVI